MKQIIWVIAVVTSLLIGLISSNQLYGQIPNHRGGFGPAFSGERSGFWLQLSDEQKAQVRAKIQEMRQQGASREEIHQAVSDLLAGFGIELPENPIRGSQNGRGMPPFFSQLSEQQRTELRQKIDQLRDQGASREEIRQAVNELLQNWGIEVPDSTRQHFRRGRRPGIRIFSRLDADQRKELHQTITQLRQQNASREDILNAVENLLTQWGIEIPENFGERFLSGPPERGHIWKILTDEQKTELRTKIRDMLANGADFETIHDAVMEQIRDWGYEVPEPPAERPARGQKLMARLTDEQKAQLRAKIIELLDANAEVGEIFQAVGDLLHEWGIEPPHRGFPGRGLPPKIMNQLNDEQRQALRAKIEELRNQGATGQEIRQAVKQMLEEFGIKLPQRSGSQSSGDKRGRSEIGGKTNLNLGNYPNPFNPQTEISYSLTEPSQVTLKIYNMQGQLIRTLVDEFQNPGSHSVKWDGTNDGGEKVVSGVYLYKLQAGKDSFSRKMMLMK